MNCPNCGSPVEAGAKFCSVCGTKLIEDTPAVSVSQAAPEIEIPQPKKQEKKEIELVLPGHEMYEEAEEEEEDLADILSPNKGLETHGNMQAQTEPQIELVLPSESPQQMQARLELERELKERRKKQEQEELRRKMEAEEQRKKQEQEDLKKQEIQDEMKRRELRKQREAEMSGAAQKTERPAAAAAAQQAAQANPEGIWGVVAYLFWFGCIAAFLKERSSGSQFLKKHVNNAFYLNVLLMLSSWIGVLEFPIFLIVTIFGIMGAFGAIKGEETELPIISQLPQIL
ncbi:MAG: zinc-ribbon domain-containing protein [Solobacterium sp.]|nr:zinc-ribbon domain-containing protein [Solobacterium sp.]